MSSKLHVLRMQSVFIIELFNPMACLRRRMFPSVRVKVRNLDPFKQYYIAMDIMPVDSKRYRCVITTTSASAKQNLVVVLAYGLQLLCPKNMDNYRRWKKILGLNLC